MKVRVANWLFLVAALGLAAGAGAFVLATDASGWADLTVALAWYAGEKWRLGLLSGVLLLLLALPLVAVMIHGVLNAPRGTSPDGVDSETTRPPPSTFREGELVVARGRRAMDRELCRPVPEIDRVIDVLLGVPVDLGASRLVMDPGGMLVELSMTFDGKPWAVTSMAQPLYRRVVEQLRIMIGCGETGEGVVSLHSSKRTEPIQISLERVERGTRVRLEMVEAEGENAADSSLKVRRRTNSAVFRLERPPMRDVITGEIPIPEFLESDVSDGGSGVQPFPSAEREVAPVVPVRGRRVVRPLESWLRLALALALAAMPPLLFWEAYGWGLDRLATGAKHAPWREVGLVVDSTPVRGAVRIQGREKGETPLSTSLPCRGKAIEILVRAEGYSTWQWSGLCPQTGALRLVAQLRPLR
jgi:hypothetical protein